MVLYKRKQITFVPPPLLPQDATPSTPVWIIPETGEWFLDYEEYLDRMSFYNVKKFVCETSGNSNFTFFEALKVEHNELFSMQSHFPEPVKEPILRHVSFSTVPRIDLLVDLVYTKFRDDFFPGDKVIVKYTGGSKVHGIIKEKVVFNSRIDENGISQKPFISYRIFLPLNQTEVVIEDSTVISRERNRFTKSYVKTFLKMSLIRSNRLGAPWVLRDDIAKKYKISLDWPNDLKKFENNNLNNSNSIILNDDELNEGFFTTNNMEFDHLNNLNKNKIKIKVTNEKIKDDKLKNYDDSSIILNDHLNNNNNNNNNNSEPQMGIFNQNESLNDYGMRSSRGFSHSIFENLKETPPAYEDLYQKWCENWYQILKRTTAYFEDLKSEDRARDKVLKLFEFVGVKITDKFDPDHTHFIVTKRIYSSKDIYSDTDPFHYVQMKRIKVWHYEKCQRFFKSIKISNRRIDQLSKRKANIKSNESNLLSNNNVSINDLDNESFNVLQTSVSNKMNSFVNIAPAPSHSSPNSTSTPTPTDISSNQEGKNFTGRALMAKKAKRKNKIKDSKENEVDVVVVGGDDVDDDDNIDDSVDNINENKSISKGKGKLKSRGKKSKLDKSSVDEDNEIKIKNGNGNINIKDEDKSKSIDINTNGKLIDKNKNENEQTSTDKKPSKVTIVDDLLLPVRNGISKPNWKILSGYEDPKFDYEDCPITTSNYLEVWIFINMFHDAFVIDTFTFDDFIYALQWNDPIKPCPLLLEIYCALLTCIISKDGELLITLPIDIKSEMEEKKRERREKKLLKEKQKNYNENNKDIIKIEIDEENNDEISDINNIDEKIHSTDDEKDDEIKEDEDINHNAYSILNYKKLSWRERLQKRDFKNGSWLIILLGIFSISEFIPEYKDEIIKIYEILAPLDEVPTPERLMINFYEKMTPVRRVSILSILMGLLLNGNIVRTHTDFVVEKATSLRRERLELQKELKVKIEAGHVANKDVLDLLRTIDIRDIKQRVEDQELEALTTQEEKDRFIELKNRGGRPVQNALPPEPSVLEKAVAAAHPEFLKLLNIRTEKVDEIESMKKNRLEIDRSLVELNCQRIRYLGRDKVWNRYWWFERNGLPNLGGNKDDDDDDDNDEMDNDDDDGTNDLRKKDDDSEYESETYLMGRIWIQGPNEIDLHHLRGGDGSGLKRKMIEEGENILKNERDWVFIDEIEDFDKLIIWLNDKGTRERLLKKELNDCKDRVISSFKARNKFLKGGESVSRLSEYIKKLQSGDVENLLVDNDKNLEVETEMKDTDDKDDQADNDDNNNDNNDTDDHIDEKKDSEGENNDSDEEEDGPRLRTRSKRILRNRSEISEVRRRSKRLASDPVIGATTRSKRRHLISDVDDYTEKIIIDETEDGPHQNDENKYDEDEDEEDEEVVVDETEDEKIERMITLLQLPRVEDDSELREKLLIKANSRLEEMQVAHREDNMVLWVNSAAIEKQGHTHYAGPVVVKNRSGRSGRGGRSNRGNSGKAKTRRGGR